MRFIVRCSSLPELPTEKKTEKAQLCVCLIVCFVLIFFLVMSMSPFYVVLLGEQILEVAVTHQLTSYQSPKTNFQTVLI